MRRRRIGPIGHMALLLVWGFPGAALGDEADPEEEAARDDNTPLPKHTVFRVEPDYTFLHGGGHTVEVKLQPTLRYRGFFVPGLVVPGSVSFARMQLYTRSTDDPRKDVHDTGLTDMLFINGVAHTFAPELAAGVGYATTVPMATSPSLDHQQWQLGPSVFVTSLPLESLQVAVLVNDFWTLAKQAGASSYTYMTVQPIVTWHFRGGAFVGTDATVTVDFTGNHRTDIPLNLGVGKAFGRSFIGGVQGWYTVAGANQGNVAVHLKLTFTL
jgi:hypothetical protein